MSFEKAKQPLSSLDIQFIPGDLIRFKTHAQASHWEIMVVTKIDRYIVYFQSCEACSKYQIPHMNLDAVMLLAVFGSGNWIKIS
jgi:hypothetical protein